MSRPKLSFGMLVYIEWTDACERPGWKSVQDAIKVYDEVKCKTVGFFLAQDKKFIIVANSIGLTEKNDVSGIWQILLASITKIKRIPLK